MSKVMDILEQVGVIPVVVIENENDAIPLIKAMKAGAYAVTIGWGITRPQIITKYIVDEMKKEIEGL